MLLACQGERAPLPDSAPAVPPALGAPPDSSALAEGARILHRFLEASREGSLTRDALRALTACPGGAESAPGPMLARFEVLPSSSRADTVVGRAVVTTVADQDADRIHPGYFVARLRIRQDTLEWDVLPSDDGAWVVCNGLRFGLTAPDSLTTWRPAGVSATTARALADSIHAAR